MGIVRVVYKLTDRWCATGGGIERKIASLPERRDAGWCSGNHRAWGVESKSAGDNQHTAILQVCSLCDMCNGARRRSILRGYGSWRSQKHTRKIPEAALSGNEASMRWNLINWVSASNIPSSVYVLVTFKYCPPFRVSPCFLLCKPSTTSVPRKR